jgi:hypothetical protein
MRIIEIVSEDVNQLHYPKTNQAGAQAAQGVAGQVGQYRAFSTLVANAEQVIPAIIKRNLPKLAQSAAGSIPGLGTILTLTWAAWDLAQGNYADSAMTATSAFTPPLTSLALMAGMITNDAYAGVYVDSQTGQPASLALDLQRDPSGTQQRLVKLKNMIVQALGTLINQGRQRITGHQGAANARAAVRNYSTAGNPAPQQEGVATEYQRTNENTERKSINFRPVINL